MEAERQSTRDEILALIPDDAKRVKVKTEKGGERWRDIEGGNLSGILEGDEIVVLNGKPVVMKTKPGRKAKPPAPKAPPPVTQTVAQLQVAKQHFFDMDPLLRQLSKGVDSEDVLHLVMHGFAQEAASLEFERQEAERTGKETSQLSIRRINALKALAETWIKRKEQLSGKTIDMDSPAFRELFSFMLDNFREAMHKGGVPRDQAETVFVSLSERMSDESWEQEARNRMKGG